MKNISVIGAGNMGAALAVGFATAGFNVKLSNRSSGKLERLKSFSRISFYIDNLEAIVDADLVIIAVKAADFNDVLEQIGTALDYNRTIVASLIPEFNLAQIERKFNRFNKAPMVARVMPNTAVSVCESMTFISLNQYAAAYPTELSDVFAAVGKVKIIDEKLFDAATVLCSCGVGYAFRYIRAAAEGGVALGFEAADACSYVCQTLRGAAAVIERFGFHPEQAVDLVTTPGGLTIDGLIEMEKNGFSAAVISGLQKPMDKLTARNDE